MDDLELLDRYRVMSLIREFELGAQKLVQENRLAGTLHLSIGQEAVAAGVCGRLRIDDRITTTHRGHGHCLAKGAEPGRMFAELLGKGEGYCRGRSGSMHIADSSTGNLGANAIVAGGVPIAVGAALAALTKGEDWIAVCFFGDGAMGQGVIYESLNIAALWKLPVLFVCENNHYAELSPVADVVSIRQIAGVAGPFGIPYIQVDGNDILAIDEEVSIAIARARNGDGPTFMEMDTYRMGGHFEGDQMKYRSLEESKLWSTRDPLLLAESRLHALGIPSLDLARIRSNSSKEIVRSIEWAESLTPTLASSLLEDINDQSTQR